VEYFVIQGGAGRHDRQVQQRGHVVATTNFSIPDDVNKRFNETFAHANRSAIVTRFPEQAVERAERNRRSDQAVRRILEIRRASAPYPTEDILRAEADAAHGLARK
jgi:hypothetical protein